MPSRKTTTKATVKKNVLSKPMSIAVNVYNIEGKIVGKKSLPKQIFAAKRRPNLEARTIRIYLVNQRQGTVSTKTRGQVSGSTRKLYRQKGTGRARQGSIRAPHRVGGGVVFGPKPGHFELKLTKKAKRQALFSALTAKLESDSIVAVDNFDKLKSKTKIAAQLLSKLPVSGKKLIVINNSQNNVIRATGNLPQVLCLPVNNLTTYSVLENRRLIFSTEALTELERIYLKVNGRSDAIK